ncbi:MAG: SemiSWEET transporter [Alphaproteobacteria bacterium]
MEYVDLIGAVAAICTSLSFIPQAVKVLRSRETSAISLGMYSLFTFGIANWLVYGIMIGDLPVICANALTLALAGLILCMKIRLDTALGHRLFGAPASPPETSAET